MTSTVLALLFALAAVLLGIALAFVPLRLLVFGMAKSIRGTIREWVQRGRDRRSVPRNTPDRRTETPPEPEPDRRQGDRRETDRRSEA